MSRHFLLAIFGSSTHRRTKLKAQLESWGNSKSETRALNAKILLSKLDLVWPDMGLASTNSRAECRHNVKWIPISMQNGPGSVFRTAAWYFYFQWPWSVYLPLFTPRSYNSPEFHSSSQGGYEVSQNPQILVISKKKSLDFYEIPRFFRKPPHSWYFFKIPRFSRNHQIFH